jgi:hypothetical protein
VRVRRPGRSLVSLHQASREPGLDLRRAHELRRTRTPPAVRVSVLVEPLDERPIRVQHPKRPSTVHRPMSESRSKRFNKRQHRIRAPKNPSPAHRPASSPRVKPVSEPPALVQAPKSPSSNHRFTSKPREAVRQTSEPLPGSEEPVHDPSARNRAPGGTFQQASAQHPGSEEPFRNTSTSLPAPWNLPTGVRTTSGFRRNHQQSVDPLSSPGWNLPTSFWPASGLRRNHQPVVDPLSSPVEPSHRRQNHLRAPKNPSAERQPAFQLRGAFPQASAQHPGSEEPFRNTSTRFPAPWNVPTGVRTTSGFRRSHQRSVNQPSRSGWNPSPSVRPASGLRRNHQPVVDPTPSSGWRTSTGVKATSRLRRTRQRQIDPNPNSGKLIAPFRSKSRLRRTHHQTIEELRASKRTLQRTPDLLQESEDTISKALSRFRGLEEPSNKLLEPLGAPKSSSKNRPLTF